MGCKAGPGLGRSPLSCLTQGSSRPPPGHTLHVETLGIAIAGSHRLLHPSGIPWSRARSCGAGRVHRHHLGAKQRKDPRARGEAFPDPLQDPGRPQCLTMCHTHSLQMPSLEPAPDCRGQALSTTWSTNSKH